VSGVKALQGTAAAQVAAPVAEVVALVADVERYPAWYPEVVRRVEALERDTAGHAAKANALLHVSVGPLVRDFNLMLAVHVEPPGTVSLRRIAHGPTDQERFEVRWEVSEGSSEGSRSRIELRLDANLSVPRLLPVGGLGDGLAQGFVSAAVRALGSSG
jgi:hypothetical protein